MMLWQFLGYNFGFKTRQETVDAIANNYKGIIVLVNGKLMNDPDYYLQDKDEVSVSKIFRNNENYFGI